MQKGRRVVALGATAGLLGGMLAVSMWGPTSAVNPAVLARLELVEGPAPTTAAPSDGRNVLLVIGCTLRKDQTSVYAPELDTMPYLASLADRGARLDDLITAAPWTKAASTAVLTSRHALEVGMVEQGPRRNEQVLPESVPTLAERFHDAGYRTIGATANPNLHSTYGFHRGFQRYRQPAADWHGKGGVKVAGRSLADLVLDDLVALDDSRPFFVQVMFVDAHSPFPDAGPVEGVPQIVADYRKGLGRLDRAIRHLVEGLAQRGLDDDTLIVVVNDHGEGLRHPEHHGKSHGRYLSPSSVGGVGVFVGPGIPAGRTVPGMASQVDLAPTLWTLAGLPARSDWGGQDLSDAIRGVAERTPRVRAYADTWFRRVSRAAYYEEGRACQLAGRDLELTDVNGITFHPGCFDRDADPTHAHPMADRVALRELNGWRLAALARGESVAVERSEAAGGLDHQLEALGYVD